VVPDIVHLLFRKKRAREECIAAGPSLRPINITRPVSHFNPKREKCWSPVGEPADLKAPRHATRGNHPRPFLKGSGVLNQAFGRERRFGLVFLS
jgi:hypothetical protein